VDFTSLIKNGCNIVDFYEAQALGPYFSMLNGPTYESLVKHFWVRASVYDKHAAKLEERKWVWNPFWILKSGLASWEFLSSSTRKSSLMYSLRFKIDVHFGD